MASTLLGGSSGAQQSAQAPPDFAKDVLPVFESNCLRCHSAAAQKGALVLDTHEDLLAGGRHGAAIVPGDAEKSVLVGMMEGRIEPRMPPKSTLRPEEIGLVRRWIDGGAADSPGTAMTLDARLPKIVPAHALAPAVYSLAWKADGGTLFVPGYREVRQIDVSGPRSARASAVGGGARSVPSGADPPGPFEGAIDLVRSVAASPDGWWVAGAGGIPGANGEVLIWDGDTRHEAFALKGHRDYVYEAVFNHRSTRIATGSYDRSVRIWDLDTGRAIRVLREHTEAVYALAFSPDDAWLASGAGDRSVKLWDVRSGRRLVTLTEPTDVVSSVDFDPAGRLSAAGADKTIRTWTLQRSGTGSSASVTATLLASKLAHSAPILRIVYSPDGGRLASTAADGVVKIWETKTWTEQRTLERQPDWAQALAWSPDGGRLAVGRFDGSVAVYDARTGRRLSVVIRGAAQKPPAPGSAATGSSATAPVPR